ncbi:MAG: transglycosylase domain-containing protein [Halobacteriovoraceae bacterium]|nr:transglycosylase domain-containing protein [Halobacteriovoraceae bacterium]
MEKENILLDLGSVVQRKDLEVIFPLLSKEEEFDQWFNDLVTEGSFSLISSPGMFGYFQVNDPVDLKIEKINDCQREYCYQHKMNFGDIPPVLWRGLIGIEDYRFLKHKGVDPKAILRALLIDLKEFEFVQGGSTLTQQLVKNLFFSNEKSFTRKFNEMILAFYIEMKYEKEEILQAYFNEVVWGSLAGVRIKGAFAASILYFNKRPQQLTNFEAAILSALLKGPYHYHPLKNAALLKERTELVYKTLKDLALVSSEDDSLWDQKKWDLWVRELERKNQDKRIKSFSEALKSKSFYQRYTIQTASEERLRDLLAQKALEGKDLAVKVYIRDIELCINPEDCNDLYYYSKVERDLETAINDEYHQVGSILKPLVYQQFFQNGLDPDKEVETAPIELDLISGKWKPTEAHEMEGDKISLLEALQKSRNIPLIRQSYEYGFSRLQEGLIDKLPTLKTPLGEYPSQLLGAIELSMKQVVNAFHKFFIDECRYIKEKDLDFEDSIIYMLSDPRLTTISKFVHPFMLGYNFFGKTGTSNNAHDNWFVGFDGRYIVAIWLGLEGDRDDKALPLSGAGASYKIYENYRMRNGKPFYSLSCPSWLMEDENRDTGEESENLDNEFSEEI